MYQEAFKGLISHHTLNNVPDLMDPLSNKGKSWYADKQIEISQVQWVLWGESMESICAHSDRSDDTRNNHQLFSPCAHSSPLFETQLSCTLENSPWGKMNKDFTLLNAIIWQPFNKVLDTNRGVYAHHQNGWRWVSLWRHLETHSYAPSPASSKWTLQSQFLGERSSPKRRQSSTMPSLL